MPRSKRGLREFIEVFDTAYSMGWLAIDLAQNLCFKYDLPGNSGVSEEDVHLAYGLTGMGTKYQYDLMGAIHKLGEVLGYTKEDYVEGADKRQGRGNCNIYIAGQGSINCDIRDLFKGKK